MNRSVQLVTSIGFVGILVILMTTDAVFTRQYFSLPRVAQGTVQEPSNPEPVTNEQAVPDIAGGARPDQGPDIQTVLNSNGFEIAQTEEENILREIMPEGEEVASNVLLFEDDRVASFTWTQNPDVKKYFTALKEALQGSFSSEMHDLVDRTEEREGKPPRDILSFRDPGLLDERIIFVRVRQRLYEFHVAEGKDAIVNGLIEALTE